MRLRDAAVVTAALGFMAVALASQWAQIARTQWQLDGALFAASVLALVFVFFLDAFGWHLILRALGVELAVRRSVLIWMLSSLTRYIPGGIWPYASRISLAERAGITPATGTISLYLETVLLTASSLAVGLPALINSTGLSVQAWHIAVLWMALGTMMHPRILRLAHRLPGKAGRAFADVPLPSGMRLVGLYLYYVLFWIVFCATFVALAQSLHGAEPRQWLIIGSSFAIAFCAGFLVIFMPGGIGVRESVLYVLLASVLTPSASLVLAIASRLWVMLGEVIALALAVIWKRNAGAISTSVTPAK